MKQPNAILASLAIISTLPVCAPAQSAETPASDISQATDWVQNCTDWDDWDKPAPPFRIHGNSWHVGTCGISAILITDPEGMILIDTGTEKGAREVIANIQELGFDPSDLLLIGFSHEHFDHVGGTALVQEMTGASLVSSAAAAPVMDSGIASNDDPQAGMHAPFAPARVDFLHEDGDAMGVGGANVRSIMMPGHTPGAMTWQWESCDGADCRTIVYADSLSAVSADDYRFSDHPEYVQAYREGIARLAQLDCDILLTPHPSASGMRDKLVAGDLTGGMDCAAYARDRLAMLEQRLAQEASQQ